MAKKRIKIKKDANNNESVSTFISGAAIPSSSSTKDEQKTPVYNKTNQYWSDIYHTSQLGSVIDRMINFAIDEGVGVSTEDVKQQEAISAFFKREDYNQLIRFLIKDYLVQGKLDLLVNTNGQVTLTPLAPYTVTREVAELSAYDTQFYTIEMKGNVSQQDHVVWVKPFKKAYYDQEVKRTVDSASRVASLQEDSLIIEKRFNAFHNDQSGYSIFMRMNNFTKSVEDYLDTTETILDKHRRGFLEIKVPLSGKVDEESGVDLNVKAASDAYKGYTLDGSVVHGDNEEWDIKEFESSQIDKEVRRAYLLYASCALGGGELLFGDASSINYSTANTQLELYVYEIKALQQVVKSVTELVVKSFLKYEMNLKDPDSVNIEVQMPTPLESVLLDKDMSQLYYDMYKDNKEDKIISKQTLQSKVNLSSEREDRLINEEE